MCRTVWQRKQDLILVFEACSKMVCPHTVCGEKSTEVPHSFQLTLPSMVKPLGEAHEHQLVSQQRSMMEVLSEAEGGGCFKQVLGSYFQFFEKFISQSPKSPSCVTAAGLHSPKYAASHLIFMGGGVRQKRIEGDLTIISTPVLISKAEKILPWSLGMYYLKRKKVTHSL